MQSNFFDRPTLAVAEDLLGKFLVRKVGKRKISIMITETEAYIGENDLASHARFGKTKRNAVMYGRPGVWYVYLIYGMHWLLNVITEPEEQPAAVLIRCGISEAGENLNGPGKITKYLKIDKNFNFADALQSDLHIEDRGLKISPKQIKKAQRVGIDYAGTWKNKLWRFILR